VILLRPKHNLKEEGNMATGLPDRAILAITVGAFWMMLPGVALSKSNPARVYGSDLTKTLDCAGNSARILGSNNKVTLTGGCTRLTILGSRNVVTVAFGTGGSIWFAGSKNEVVWTTPDGKEPKVRHLGYGNTLKRGQ
jgi:hypothetical protein